MRLVLAAAFAGTIACQAFAQARSTEDVQRELKQAAEKVAAAYRSGGMSELVSVTQQCYQRVAQNGFRCVYLDLGARYIDQSASSAGMPATPYFSDGIFGSRVGSVFRMASFTNQQAGEYLRNVAPIMGQLTASAYKTGAPAGPSASGTEQKQSDNPRPKDEAITVAASPHAQQLEKEFLIGWFNANSTALSGYFDTGTGAKVFGQRLYVKADCSVELTYELLLAPGLPGIATQNLGSLKLLRPVPLLSGTTKFYLQGPYQTEHVTLNERSLKGPATSKARSMALYASPGRRAAFIEAFDKLATLCGAPKE